MSELDDVKRIGHTPGPWEYDGDYIWAEGIKGYVADPNTEDMQSGNIIPHSKAKAMIDANARLIAAAPELLAALQALIKERDAFIADREGVDPFADPGCIDCTVGTVPNRLNTGLCAYHCAKLALHTAGVA